MPIVGERQTRKPGANGYSVDAMAATAKQFGTMVSGILEDTRLELFTEPTKALRNPIVEQTMKQYFLERLAYVYRTLTPQVMNDKLTQIKAILEPEMAMHFERWAPLNDKKINSDSPLSKDGALGYWNTRINRMRDTINRRHHFLWEYIKEAFNLTNAQMLELFGEQPSDPLAKKK